MILADSLPMYQVRQHEKIEKEGDLLLITTYYNKYVVDDRSLSGNFNKRRAHISTHIEEYPYSLYPLSKRVSTLAQVAESIKLSKFFIDNSGNIINYKPRAFYSIRTYPIVNTVLVGHEKFLITVKVDVFSHINLISPYTGRYAQLINIGNTGFVLYNVSMEDLPTTRRKL